MEFEIPTAGSTPVTVPLADGEDCVRFSLVDRAGHALQTEGYLLPADEVPLMWFRRQLDDPVRFVRPGAYMFVCTQADRDSPIALIRRLSWPASLGPDRIWRIVAPDLSPDEEARYFE